MNNKKIFIIFCILISFIGLGIMGAFVYKSQKSNDVKNNIVNFFKPYGIKVSIEDVDLSFFNKNKAIFKNVYFKIPNDKTIGYKYFNQQNIKQNFEFQIDKADIYRKFYKTDDPDITGIVLKFHSNNIYVPIPDHLKNKFKKMDITDKIIIKDLVVDFDMKYVADKQGNMLFATDGIYDFSWMVDKIAKYYISFSLKNSKEGNNLKIPYIKIRYEDLGALKNSFKEDSDIYKQISTYINDLSSSVDSPDAKKLLSDFLNFLKAPKTFEIEYRAKGDTDLLQEVQKIAIKFLSHDKKLQVEGLTELLKVLDIHFKSFNS